MVAANVILPAGGARRWHRHVVERLAAVGHGVTVSSARTGGDGNRLLELLLAAERRIRGTVGTSLTEPVPGFGTGAFDTPGRIAVDLSEGGNFDAPGIPVLSVLFQGRPELAAAAEVLCRGRVPVVDLYLDGRAVAHAAPMTYGRSFISRGLDDVVARAITLVVDFVVRYASPAAIDRVAGTEAPPAEAPTSPVALAGAYLSSALPRLALKTLRNLRYHEPHWRIGYRWLDGAGVARTRSLAGPAWSVLPDTGDRFYADPFPVEWHGRHYLFVEEFVHALGKGVIAVAEAGPDGRFGTPRRVLEEPHHLSYPQVFAHGRDLWMIPESAAGGQLVLYRARDFPREWVRHAVLLSDCEVFDATLLRHRDRFWLFGSERDGAGNGSDTMVVFLAEGLEGPWRRHPMNPVRIDKSAARPGGAFVRDGNRILLPLQDGTAGYGGGLGLSEVLRLDPVWVELSPPMPIDGNGDWPYPLIHSLNRQGRLECIDGLAKVARRRAGR